MRSSLQRRDALAGAASYEAETRHKYCQSELQKYQSLETDDSPPCAECSRVAQTSAVLEEK